MKKRENEMKKLTEEELFEAIDYDGAEYAFCNFLDREQIETLENEELRENRSLCVKKIKI